MEQVGVNAPGTATNTTRRFAVNTAVETVWTCNGLSLLLRVHSPELPATTSWTSGIREPIWGAMGFDELVRIFSENQ